MPRKAAVKPLVVTFQELSLAYLAFMRARGLKQNSVTQADRRMRMIGRYLGMDFNMAEMTQEHLSELISVRLAVTKPASVNTLLTLLKALLRYAVYDLRILPAMPVKIRMVKAERRTPRVLTEPELEKLLRAAAAQGPVGPKPPKSSEEWSASWLAILIASRTGMRHNEILHLQAKDVDLVNQVVRVSAKAGWQPKNWCERDIPMTKKLKDALEPVVTALEPGQWLFPGYEGRPMRDLQEPVAIAFRKAGLWERDRKPGLHMLRRTWATELLGRGVDLETVRQLGGWGDLLTVQRYVTSTDERKRAAIKKLED